MWSIKVLSVSLYQCIVLNIVLSIIQRILPLILISRSNTSPISHHTPLIPAHPTIPRISHTDFRRMNACTFYSFSPLWIWRLWTALAITPLACETVNCLISISQTLSSYVCRDSGQYPCGNSLVRGVLAPLGANMKFYMVAMSKIRACLSTYWRVSSWLK